tara:strand:+ start:972 stop:2777 length:1806 start_codon:yes stop_codon:yes gene_type:complete
MLRMAGLGTDIRRMTILLDADTKKALTGLAAVTAALMVVKKAVNVVSGAFKAIIQDTADYGDEMAITAAQANLNTQTWMKMAHAADIAGVKQQHLMTFFRRMGDNAQDAANGTGMAVTELTALFGTLDKMPKGQFELFEQLIDPIGGLLNGTDAEMRKAGGMLSSIGGRSGGKMAPLFKLGLAQVRELMKEAVALGLVLDPTITDATQKWNDEVIRVQRSFEGVRNTIGARLLPQVTKLATGAHGWVSAQRDIIQAGFEPWIRLVEWGFYKLLRTADRVRRVFDQFRGATKKLAGWSSKLIIFLLGSFGLVNGMLLLAKSIAVVGVSLKFLFGAWKAFFLNPQVLLTLWWLLAIGVALRLLFLFFDDLATFMRGGHSVLGEIFGRESGKALGTFFKDMTGLVKSLMGPMSMLGAAVWDLGEALLQLVGIDLMPLKDLGDWFERELSEAALGAKIMTAQLEKGMTPLTNTELFSIQRAHDKERNAFLSPEYHERERLRSLEDVPLHNVSIPDLSTNALSALGLAPRAAKPGHAADFMRGWQDFIDPGVPQHIYGQRAGAQAGAGGDNLTFNMYGVSDFAQWASDIMAAKERQGAAKVGTREQ